MLHSSRQEQIKIGIKLSLLTWMTSPIETQEVFAHGGNPCTRKSRKVEGIWSLGTWKLRMASTLLSSPDCECTNFLASAFLPCFWLHVSTLSCRVTPNATIHFTNKKTRKIILTHAHSSGYDTNTDGKCRIMT